eukprot:TRINITY_DN3024_c0_g1_i1.p1 TRINITY_DN3024_c0_g1~~TRINITY_DN3024_c0_g1_i1.p1  ORF type:complete len:177 (-),score=28.12 TRINITY_DN3024_c0_g1_i1:563-1093(-)
MGCNSSKNQDVSRSRNAPASPAPKQQTSNSAQVRSPAHQISQKEEKPEVNMPEPSYSDRKIAEMEFFKDVIERATNKFIDVAEEPNQSAPSYADHRKDYNAALSSISVNVEKVRIFQLPRLSSVCSEPKHILSESGIVTQTDIEFASKWTSALSLSLTAFKTRECGQLIVPFPEIA